MKKYRKTLFIVIISLFVALGAAQNSFAAASDMSAPVVTAVSLDKHQVYPGDKITVTMNVSDDSEISTDPDSDYKTFLYLKNGSNYTDLFYFTKKSAGVYTSTVTIPSTYVNGYYFLGYLVVTDVAGNEFSSYSYSSFPAVYFEVKGASSDETAPAIRTLSIDKHSAVPGDQVTVSCEITDASNLNLDMYSTYLYLKNDSYQSAPFVFEKTGANLYSATITVDQTYVNGRYQFSEIALTDASGNTYYNADASAFPEVYVDVTGASDDRSAPVVSSLSIDKQDAQLGDSLTITAVVEDDSKLEERSIQHYLILKNGSFYSDMFLFEKVDDLTYAATVPVTEDYYDGTYAMEYYIVSDIIGNSKISYGTSEFPEVFFRMSGHSALEYYHKPGWFMSGGKWYFNDAKGNRVTGWLKRGSNWYYLNNNGEMQTGWVKSGGKWYYLDTISGAMRTGWINDQGTWYFADSSGAMQTGWLNRSGLWYFFDSSGAMQTGWIKSGVKWYFLDHTSGTMQTGWIYDQGSWYYLDPSSGAMQTGWLKRGNQWYFLNSSGAMQTGWAAINGKWYYLDPVSGAMQTGWVAVDGKWYYLNSSGAMQTGWQKINNVWYFFKSSGAMAASEWYGGYWFGTSGAWTYRPIGSWKQNSKGWWFGDTSGWYAKNETIRINDQEYTFDENGYWIDPNAVVESETEETDE